MLKLEQISRVFLPKKKPSTLTENRLISGRSAKRLVGDPAIIEAFEEVRDAYLTAWANTLPDEQGKRELAYQHYKAVEDVRANLESRARTAQAHDAKVAAEQPNVS